MKTRCCYPKRYLLLFFSLLVSVGSILMSVSIFLLFFGEESIATIC